ncbi:ferredoxin family protein [uncultured Phascolarctobacterium sp.]|uniref:4Fe-4S dicluster domain-containing protein n=1 Tax=uncultured Phascolarctobacterium sp. TaxID=512296 RepID=UPI0025ED342B|nr:4Fe-4S binding protein [uncultured Phascolarctobacterium sp.]
MSPDAEGFTYPVVDTTKCVNCGLCVQVCPLLHKPQPSAILAVMGCKNTDESVRFTSSSGGFFHWRPQILSPAMALSLAPLSTSAGKYATSVSAAMKL